MRMSNRVEYDDVATNYDRRYATNDYAGVEATIIEFAAARREGGHVRPTVLEVGCGTGHWLAMLAALEHPCAGIDRSRGMLTRARLNAPTVCLVQAAAESLPWRSASVDRVLVVNALHHFAAPAAFFAEARRVLRPGGGLLTVGLDPHAGRDQWWIYDHFPSALAADRARYPATARIRDGLTAAGFQGCRTTIAQHWPVAVSVPEAETKGFLDRTSTSQLLVIPDAEYEAGLARIRALCAAPGETAPLLQADLRVYGTTAWLAA